MAASRLEPLLQVMRLAVPTMGMYLLLISAETISLITLGRAPGSTAAEIAGLGLGNLVYNVAALAVGFGFTSSQDTLVTQAAGRGDFAICRLYLNRCQLWMFVIAACSSCVIFSTEPLLLLLGVTDPVTARHTGNYSRFYVGGLLGTFQYSALRKFLLAQKDAMAGLLVQMVSVPLHIMWCQLLVPQYHMKGVGMAMMLKGWTDFSLLALYTCLRRKEQYRGWWRFWSALRGERAWRGIWEYLRLALPGVIMFVAEWWAFEILGIFAAYLHSPQKLAAHVTVGNVSAILYLSGTGAQKAASTLVGQAVGKGAGREASLVARAALAWNGLCSLAMGMTALLLRRHVMEVYAPGKSDVQSLGLQLLPFVVVQGCLDGANQLLQGAIYGLGLQKRSGRVSLLSYWLVLPPAALLLCFVLHLEVRGLWLGLMITTVVTLSLNLRIYAGADFDAAAQEAQARMALDAPGDCAVSLSPTSAVLPEEA